MKYTGMDDTQLILDQKEINRLESMAADRLIREHWDRKLYQESICKDIFYRLPYPDREPIKHKWYKMVWWRICDWPIWHLHIVDIRDYHKHEDCDW